MLCNRCNNVVPDGSLMCNYCGNDLSYLYQNQTVQNDTNKNGLSKGQKATILILLVLVLVLLLIALKLVLDDDELVTLEDGSRTIMIYMVGSNLESDSKIATSEIASIDPDSIDLDKTNILLYTGGTKKWHNFVSNEENAIYELKEDGFEKVETYDKKNMGDYETLLSFLNYSTDNYEAQYYDLVFYNHGGAIQGAIYDDFTNDNLSLLEFEKALDKSDFNEKNKLNTVLFRTCLNGTIEIASVFAPYADYLIASEEVTNGKTGESVLNFMNNLSSDDDGVEYGKKFIEAYEKQIENIDPIGFSTTPMYSIIDLSKVDRINELLNDFVSNIDLKENYKNIVKVRSKMYQYGYTTYNESAYDTVDLYSLVEGLAPYSKEDSEELLNAIDDAVVYNWSKEESSNGLSVYFPYNANQKYQEMFLLIYKNLEKDNDSYYKFIGQFNSLSTSKGATSFSKVDLKDKEVKIDNNKEFSLQLTEEQQNDYANSIYLIFRKDEDGLYNPIYSSDNTEITSDGLLKTNISNNLIKVYDKSKPEVDGGYLTIVERGSTGKRKLVTTAVLNDFSSDEMSEWKTVASTVYFEISDNVPKVSNYIELSNEDGVSGTILNPSDYSSISYTATSYKILDENGNYTDNWDNNGTIGAYELKLDNVDLRLSSLDDGGEYFCVFKIQDIYGNVYYSKLLSIN